MSYMIQTILPSLMMVLCSYGSLFIPHDQVSISGLNFVCRLLFIKTLPCHELVPGPWSDGVIDHDHADVGDSQQWSIQHFSAHVVSKGMCHINLI